jgi:hypothetical protein
MYDAIQYRGGVYNKAFAAFFAGAAERLETLVTPVDTDPDKKLLAQAQAERRHATLRERVDLGNERYAFRDALTLGGKLPGRGASLWPLLERINAFGVAVYRGVCRHTHVDRRAVVSASFGPRLTRAGPQSPPGMGPSGRSGRRVPDGGCR